MANEFVTSIPSSILGLLNERGVKDLDRYTPSHMARIINRSISNQDAKSYAGTKYDFLRRGHFTNSKLDDISIIFYFSPKEWQDGFGVVTRAGYTVYYKDFISPGLKHGESILKQLDETVRNAKPDVLREDQQYLFAAFIALAIGAAHAFPDGNGRAAIGVANIYLNRLTGRKLDESKLILRNKDLEIALTYGSIGSFPAKYNAYQVIENAQNSFGSDKTITLAPPSHRPEVSADERHQFLEEYASCIKKFIEDFKIEFASDPEKAPINQRLSYEGIKKLALIFKDCSIAST